MGIVSVDSAQVALQDTQRGKDPHAANARARVTDAAVPFALRRQAGSPRPLSGRGGKGD